LHELIIDISKSNPTLILGVRNAKLKVIKRNFPKLKLVARGATIKAFGEQKDLDEFQKKITAIFKHVEKFNTLSENEIEQLLKAKKEADNSKVDDKVLVYGNNGLRIKARTKNQRLMEVRRIVLTRPAVEAGENLGFLPGDMKEKLDPYMMPLYDGLRDMIHHDKLSDYLENGTIEVAPLAFMRGRTLDNAFVILDEAQNTTVQQMKMFLTRMGKHAKFIITGDASQIDLPKKQKSGLIESLDRLKEVNGISIIRLTGEDVIRHKLVKEIIKAFEE